MDKLSDELKALVRMYVKDVMAESAPKPLTEVFTLAHEVRATVDRVGAGFVDLPPGSYLVSDVDTTDEKEKVSLLDSQGFKHTDLVTRFGVNETQLGQALFIGK